MRFLLLAALLAACGAPSPPAAPPPLLRIEAKPVEGIVVDGQIDDLWARAAELTAPLTGGGPSEVRLKAAHDGKRLYLLAIWSDAKASQSRYWSYEGNLRWRKSETEDGFAVCWSPAALSDAFRSQGCAAACHEGHHAYAGTGSGRVDFWYWGAQQCALFPQARDMWLREGEGQRLRGDHQPEDSDNIPNLSGKYEGPCLFPQIRRSGDNRMLPWGKNLQEVTPDWIRQHWTDEASWIGHEVPLDLLRGRKGSRGDVMAAARHFDEPGNKWVLELSRDLETGNPDDLPLGTSPVLFAVAVLDDAAGADHAVSGPIELSFLPAP